MHLDLIESSWAARLASFYISGHQNLVLKPIYTADIYYPILYLIMSHQPQTAHIQPSSKQHTSTHSLPNVKFFLSDSDNARPNLNSVPKNTHHQSPPPSTVQPHSLGQILAPIPHQHANPFYANPPAAPTLSSQPCLSSANSGRTTKCSCGFQEQVQRLRRQLQRTRAEYARKEQETRDWLYRESARKENELLEMYNNKLEEMKLHYQNQRVRADTMVRAPIMMEDERAQYRQRLKTYECFIQNAEKNKESLRGDIQKYRRDNLEMQAKLQAAETDNANLQQEMMRKDMQINDMMMEMEHRGSGYYVEELERTNQNLAKENRRLNQIIKERIKSALY